MNTILQAVHIYSRCYVGKVYILLLQISCRVCLLKIENQWAVDKIIAIINSICRFFFTDNCIVKTC